MATDVRPDSCRQARPAYAGAATPRLRARIVEWQAARGFGFLAFEGHRIFVHHRDFIVQHKRPEVGDVVEFKLGRDGQGRVCARQAEHCNDGGRLRLWHLGFLLLLLAAPGYAHLRACALYDWRWVFGAPAGLSLIAYLMYWRDKRRARRGEWRISESALHLVSLLGGWPGAFIAQRHFHHKSAKLSFQVLFWLIVALHQFLAVDSLRGWPMMRAANAEFMNRTMSVRKADAAPDGGH